MSKSISIFKILGLEQGKTHLVIEKQKYSSILLSISILCFAIGLLLGIYLPK